MQIRNWINHHNEPKSRAMVCGLGESLKDLQGLNYKNVYVYGVNDIESFISPNYLIVNDNIWKEYKDLQDQQKSLLIQNHKAHLFARSREDSETETKIQVEQINLLSDLNSVHKNHHLWSYQTSVITALSLAVYMGVQEIGIIGLDMYGTNYKLNNDYVQWWNYTHIRIMRKLINKIAEWLEKQDRHLYNLSPYSRVTNELPLVDLKEFLKIE